MIFLSSPSEFWDYRNAPLCTIYFLIFYFTIFIFFIYLPVLWIIFFSQILKDNPLKMIIHIIHLKVNTSQQSCGYLEHKSGEQDGFLQCPKKLVGCSLTTVQSHQLNTPTVGALKSLNQCLVFSLNSNTVDFWPISLSSFSSWWA
jgi:hypothetical protein